MPARAADLDEALQKKGGLTLSQLANYDDLITDALVDRVSIYYRLLAGPRDTRLTHVMFARFTSGLPFAS